jgi:hypothetical protein
MHINRIGMQALGTKGARLLWHWLVCQPIQLH